MASLNETLPQYLIVYCRVSSESQAREESVERQIANFESIKSRFEDLTLVQRSDESPYFIDNPFNLELIKEGTAIHEVIQQILRLPPGSVTLFVSEMDRLTRSNSDEVRGRITDLLRFQKVRVFTKYGEESSNELALAIQSAVGADDKRRLIRKCHEGKRMRLEKEGAPPAEFWPGGYEWNRRTRTWSLVENEITLRRCVLGLAIGKAMECMTPKMVLATKLYPEGMGDREIAVLLNQEGFSMTPFYHRVGRLDLARKNPEGHFTENRVSNLLRDDNYRGKLHFRLRTPEQVNNPVYRDMSRDDKDLFTVDVPRIFSDEEWEAYRAVRIVRQNQPKENTKHNYLVRGLVHCPLCDNKHTARPRFMKGAWYLYYTCQRRKKIDGTSCSASRYHNAQAFDEVIWKMVRDFVLNGKNIEAIESMRGSGHTETVTPDLLLKQIQSIDSRLEKIKEERLRTVSLYTKGTISESDMQELLKPLDKESKGATKEREQLKAKLKSLEILPEAPSFDMSLLRGVYQKRIDALSFEEKKLLVETVLDRVDLWPDGSFKVFVRPFSPASCYTPAVTRSPTEQQHLNTAPSGTDKLGESEKEGFV